MKNLIPYVLHPAIGTGVIADNWHGISEAGNIAIAAIWIIVFLAFLACAFGDKDDLKNGNTTKVGKYLIRLFFVSNVFILFVAGWFVTGAFLLIAWLAMWIKKLDKPSEEAKAT
jgi:predicted membrane protein